MVFEEKQGDLFKIASKDKYHYVHCISRDYALGAGIAVQFNKRYNMSRKLKELPHTDVMLVDNVFNLVTKSKYWQKPTYESLEKCLKDLKELCKSLNIKKIAMPKIGCGLDKLKWSKVKKMIKNIFDDLDIEILICYL